MSRKSARHGTLKQDAGTVTTPAQSSTSNVKPTRALNDPRYKNE